VAQKVGQSSHHKIVLNIVQEATVFITFDYKINTRIHVCIKYSRCVLICNVNSFCARSCNTGEISVEESQTEKICKSHKVFHINFKEKYTFGMELIAC